MKIRLHAALIAISLLFLLAGCEQNPPAPVDPPPPPPVKAPAPPDNTCNEVVTACSVELAKPVQGRIAEGDDGKFYKFTIDEPGVLEMSLKPVPTDQALRFSWYDETGEKLLAEERAPRDGTPLFMTQVTRAGTYLIEVDALGSSDEGSEQDFTLSVGLFTDDPYEYNNTPAEAKPIALDEPIQAYNYGFDTDFYTITLSQTTPITIRIETAPADLGMLLKLFEEKSFDSSIAFDSGSAGEPFEITTKPLQPGKYYIEATHAGFGSKVGSRNPYTLKVSTD